jgi:amidohydrolase
MKNNLVELLENAYKLEMEITAWRRDVHSHPELGFQEHRTAQLVANVLHGMGIQVTSGVGKTGVIGIIGKGKPAIGIRADMDALAVQEANEVPYKSQTPGVMHACGHDAHVAILLGVASLISHMEERPPGEIRLLFQPSEENIDEEGKSGAVRMVEEGALKGLDAVLALHVTSDIPAGQFEIVDGYPTASVDLYDAVLIGKGCHDAYPHTGLDPIFLLGQVINAIYGIRAIRINPVHPSIVSISTVHAGNARNVVPSTVQISGTLRSSDDETRESLILELEKALSVASALGGDYKLTLKRQAISTRNNPEIVSVLRKVVVEMFGEDSLIRPEPGMAGEDFGYMSREIPGIWFQFGARKGKDVRPHHSPIFDLDEAVFPKGAAVLAATTYRLMRQFAS